MWLYVLGGRVIKCLLDRIAYSGYCRGMCLICIEFQKQRMTLGEARRAYGEMVEGLEPEHAREVSEMLDKAQEIVDDPD